MTWGDELTFLISWFKRNGVFATIDIINIGFNIRTTPFKCGKPKEYSTITCLTGETDHVIEWVYNEIRDGRSSSFSLSSVIEVIDKERENRTY